VVELVVEITAAVFLPSADQGTGGDGDLVGRGADDGFDVDPVGVTLQVVIAAVFGAITFERPHQLLLAKAQFLAFVGVSEFAIAGIADDGADGAVEEGAVLYDFDVADGVLKTAIVTFGGEVEGDGLAGGQGFGEVVDAVEDVLVVLGERCTRKVYARVVVFVEREVNFIEGLRVGIVDDFFAPEDGVACLRIDVDGVADAVDTRHGLRVKSFIVLFVSGLEPAAILGA